MYSFAVFFFVDSSPVKVAAAQVGSILFDVPSPLVKVDNICRQAA